jgi:hypothetical protein
MAAEIENLANDIGLPVETLRKMLPHDEPCIARLMENGYSRENAEEVSFIGDLRNVLDMMTSDNFSAKTAAYILRQDPDVPVFFDDSTDKEDEDETASSEELRSASPARSSSSSNNSSNSEDERIQEAKRIKLDPDFVPSATTSEDTSTASTTANNSAGTTEVEETETETEEEDWEPSDSTESEKELSEEEEEDD